MTIPTKSRLLAPAATALLWTILAAGFIVPRTTYGDDGREQATAAARAEALIRQAVELRRAGKDALAYPLVQQAYEVQPTPRTAAQLALVEMVLGYWLLAESHLGEALASPRDPWVHANRASLEDTLTKVKSAIGEIVVSGTPAGAEVLVNGKVEGTLPLSAPLRIGEGPVKLEVRASGHSPFYRSLAMVGGKRETVSVALTETVAAAVKVGPDASSAGPHQLETRAADADRGSRFSTLARPLAWGTSVAAAGALGFGVHQTVRWRDHFSAFENRRDCGTEESKRGGPGCAEIHSDLTNARRNAVIGYIVGGLLAAGSATLFLLPPAGEDEKQAARVSCGFAPSFDHGFCRFTF